MAQSYASITTDALQELQDSGIAIFEAAETVLQSKRAFRWMANWVPHVVQITFTLESRTGTADEDTASHLVDDASVQFLSSDTNKAVYNATDKTWGLITAYTDAGDVTLNKDLFPDGNEAYYLFNKGCQKITQINIGDVTDMVDVIKVEYPFGTERGFSIDGDILTIDIDESVIPDTGSTEVDKNVEVWFSKRHKVSQLTTLTGAVNLSAGYDAGDTSMILDTLQTTGTIEEGQEFTVAGTRGLYTVTADATISSSAATISFFPGLENDVDNDTVVTFVKSTLTPMLEPLAVGAIAGHAAISAATQPIQSCVTAISILTTVSTTLGYMTARIEAASKASTGDLALGRAEVLKGVALVTTQAGAEIDKMSAEITQALADLDSGRALLNTVPKGGIGTPGAYVNYAAGDVNNAIGAFRTAQGFITEAQGGGQNSNNYINLAMGELRSATEYMNQSIGYMRSIESSLRLAGTWQHYHNWGRSKLAQVQSELQMLVRKRPVKLQMSRT